MDFCVKEECVFGCCFRNMLWNCVCAMLKGKHSLKPICKSDMSRRIQVKEVMCFILSGDGKYMSWVIMSVWKAIGLFSWLHWYLG